MAAVLNPQARNQPTHAPDTSWLSASESLIDRHSHFNGVYRTAGNLRIEGSAEGDIECTGTVIIEHGARAEATVRAGNAVIAGWANGQIACQERFTIQPTGEMHGRVQAASLVVEEGAFFEGEFHMAEDVHLSDGLEVNTLRREEHGSDAAQDNP